MSEKLLDLKRLWRPASVPGSSDRIAFMGALFPQEEKLHPQVWGLYHLRDLARHDCLVLLGRPGAGKTSEVEHIKCADAPGFADERVVSFACRELGSNLREAIFRSHSWDCACQQEKPIRLVLDGLDEGLLRDGGYFDQLRALIADELKAQRFRLLLTCRPAEWDEAVGRAIIELWGRADDLPVYVLEPLSPEGRQTLAAENGVTDFASFFNIVAEKNFEEFAVWPRTLEWLAQEFAHGGLEARSYTDLCRRRVARAFEDPNRRLVANRVVDAHEMEYAIMLLAAALVFCGKKGVAIDQPNADCIYLNDFFADVGPLQIPDAPALTRDGFVAAVRNSDLLEGHDGYHRFHNQTDAEFLASAMLGDLKAQQLAELMGRWEEHDRWYVHPPLATTAANLAVRNPQFFEFLLRHDPRVLLRADFASLDEEKRRRSVDAILHEVEEIGASGSHVEHAHLHTLQHPGLAEQLRQWLFNPRWEPETRRLAFDIVMSCGCEELAEDFWRLIWDKSDTTLLSLLPLAVMRFGEKWSDERLLQLARGEAPGDEDDRLAGAALDVLVPKRVSLGNVAPILRDPGGGMIAAYQMFLIRAKDYVQPSDVVPLLNRLAAWPSSSDSISCVHELFKATVRSAVQNLHEPTIRDALVRFVLDRIKDDDPLFAGQSPEALHEWGFDDPTNRRNFLRALMDYSGVASLDQFQVDSLPVRPEDFGWLLEQLSTLSAQPERACARMAARFVWRHLDQDCDALERAYRSSAELRALLPPAGPDGICATLRQQQKGARARWEWQQAKLETRTRERPGYDHAKEFAKAIKNYGKGDAKAWLALTVALSRPPRPGDLSDFFNLADITSLPAWAEAPKELRAELRKAARQYLLAGEIELPGPRQISIEMIAHNLALALHREALSTDMELRDALRPSWVQSILRSPSPRDDPLPEVLLRLNEINPTIVANGILAELTHDWNENQSLWGGLISGVWSSALRDRFVELLHRAPIQPNAYVSGLEILSDQDEDAAQSCARDRLHEYLPLPDSPARRAAIAACLFLVPELWQHAWPAFIAARASAEQLLLEYSTWLSFRENETLLEAASTELLTSLFELLVELFPYSDRGTRWQGGSPSGRDHAHDLRDRCQSVLERRGQDAVLRRIYQRHQELSYRPWTLHSIERARTSRRTSVWRPPDVSAFVKFLANEGGTFVDDEESLQRAILQSLQRFEEQLYPSRIWRIWDERKTYKPRTEEILQIEIDEHLRAELGRVVINMETKVQRRDRADIRVEAFPRCKSAAGPLAVTLEVKLGHSTAVQAKMETQLRDQYLVTLRETHGIYVVGWFFGEHYRPRTKFQRQSPKEAQSFFDEQARSLSTGGYYIVAKVLDCALRVSSRHNARTGQRRKNRKRRATAT